MKKQKTKAFFTISLIGCLTALTACSNVYKDRQAEFMKNIEQRAELRMSAVLFELDANGDHVLTCTDSDLLKARLMNRFDANNDQALSSDEYQEVRLSVRRFVYFDFKMVDKNQDNSISQFEFTSIPNDRLKSFDLDENCEISDDELKKGIIANILQGRNPNIPRQKRKYSRPRKEDTRCKDNRRRNGGNRGERCRRRY